MAATPNPALLPSNAALLRRLMVFVRPYAAMLILAGIAITIFSGGRFLRAYLMKPLLDDVLLPATIAAKDLDGGTSRILDQLRSGSPTAAGVSPDTSQETSPDASPGITGDATPDGGPAPGPDSNARDAPTRSPGMSPEIEAQLRGGIREVLLGAAVLVFLMPIALYYQTYFIQYIMARISIDLKVALAAKLLTLPLRAHHEASTGDTLTRALQDASQGDQAVRLLLSDFLKAGVMVTIGAGTMFFISWQLALIALISAPAIVGVLALFARRIRRTARKRQEQLGEVTQRLLAILSGIKVIKAFRGESLERAAFEHETDKLFRRNLKVVKNRVAQRSLVEMLNSGTGVGMLLLGTLLVLQGRFGLTTGDVASFAMVLATTYKPIKSLSRGWASLMDSLASVQRYFEMLDTRSEVADPVDPVRIDGVRDAIRFRDVSFGYGSEPVLRGVSLEVKKGEVIAVVGPTGGGKTTLMDLLLRFYDPDSGAIEIDGVDMRCIARDSLLDQIAIVTQEPFLFDTSIRENVAYGRPSASEQEIAEAMRAAHVDEFVDQLPDGDATAVGEFGLRLSGGQRQRITIARAILKNPALLVFDEATSALDAKTERTVQDAIDALRGERTIFLVAHRLSTIRRADRIVVLERGRIVQSGTHDELMAIAGIYRDMVSLQVRAGD